MGATSSMRICGCQEVVQASSLPSNISIQIQLMALQLSFNNFPQAVHYQRFRLVQKSLSKTLMQLTACWAQPRWPLSSCQDSIWHICAPLHVILARALVNQPDLHSIDYFCHSFPRGFIQDSSCIVPAVPCCILHVLTCCSQDMHTWSQ